MPCKPYKLFSDATLTQGAWVNHNGVSKNFPLPPKFKHGMFAAEFYAAYRAILDNIKYKNMNVHLYCDNTSVCEMLNNRSARHPNKYPEVNSHLVELMKWLETNKVSLSVWWIRSKSNPADKPSRSELMQQ